ncbi:MAG: AAA family ATPase, partial [Actinomycetota bacterium]
PVLDLQGETPRPHAPEGSWLPHERRRVTVVAVDVAPHSDSSVDPEVVTRAGEEAAVTASEVVARYGGRVERAPGDQLVAFFGFPVAHEDDPLRAVNAALDLRTAVHRLNAASKVGQVMFRARVGLDTGEVVVGPGATLTDAVRGPVVSLAGRLQHAADDAEILVGPGAQRLLRGAVIVDHVEGTEEQGLQAWRVLEVVSQAPAIPRTFDAPMIGRQSELTRLRSAFRRALRTGRVVPVTVIGEAGIGKSRLAREVMATLSEDARTLLIRHPPPGDAMGFFPVRQAVVETAGILGWRALHDLLANAHDGIHAVPAVAEAIPLRSPPASGEELVAPLLLLLETLARLHPLIVVVEDLQWAETAFRDAMEVLAREATGSILLLCLARPDGFEDGPGWGEMVTLEPLDSGDIARLAIERAGPLAEPLLRRIVDLAQGNPLFAEQLVAAIDHGDLETIPASLAGLVTMRLDRLGPGERDLLRVASIAGVDVELDVVEALLPEAARRVLDRHLQVLQERRLIERVAPRSIRFAHALIQIAAYQTMTRDDRARLEHDLATHIDRERKGNPVAVLE